MKISAYKNQKEKMEEKENKYEAGNIVYAKSDPDVKLVVRRYLKRIYYCKFYDEPDRKELAMFERELFSEEEKAAAV